MKFIAYYAIYNEADFIEYSLRSIYDHVDRIIIIEGAWAETYYANGHKRSFDGTLEKIRAFPDPLGKIELHFHNEANQLAQRDTIFQYLPKEPHWMWLIDGDEVYKAEDIYKMKSILAEDGFPFEMVKINSYTFVNDFFTYTPIDWPRLFKLDPSKEGYTFTAPNDIRPVMPNGEMRLLYPVLELQDVYFYHYSYCKSIERFREKWRERTKLHGGFQWELRGGLVQRDGANLQVFSGTHPEWMKAHPLYNQHFHKFVPPDETIVFLEHSGIGNLICATPMLQALRQIKPKAQIYVSTWSRSARVLEGLPCVDIVFAGHPLVFVQNLKRPIDILLLSPAGGIGPIAEAMATNSKQVITANVNGVWGKHEIEYKMDLVRKLGYRGPTPATQITVFPINHEKVENIFNSRNLVNFIVINAAYLKEEHWVLKHWGNSNYLQLLQQLMNLFPNLSFLFVGSKEDFQDAEDIIKGAQGTERCLNMCGWSDDIKDTAAILARAQLSVGNDGGIQHIAAAVGTPTVTIFTFTNPIKNMPPSKKGRVVMNPCAQRIGCQHGNFKTCVERGCTSVSVDKVVEAIRAIL